MLNRLVIQKTLQKLQMQMQHNSSRALSEDPDDPVREVFLRGAYESRYAEGVVEYSNVNDGLLQDLIDGDEVIVPVRVRAFVGGPMKKSFQRRVEIVAGLGNGWGTYRTDTVDGLDKVFEDLVQKYDLVETGNFDGEWPGDLSEILDRIEEHDG